ncbi:hypothetical protein SRRS_44330 [Sporomusa rhizae]|uniref:hypothetical protein n=1 Tax=Sporomusa rhizae TaxID=357999 RepID=UPI003529F918
MNEKNLDRLETLMEQLVRTVGNIGADIEEVKNEIIEIKSTMATKTELADTRTELRDGFAALDAKIEKYGQVQQQDIYHLLKLSNQKLETICEDIKSVAEIAGEHEKRIRTLSRRPV